MARPANRIERPVRLPEQRRILQALKGTSIEVRSRIEQAGLACTEGQFELEVFADPTAIFATLACELPAPMPAAGRLRLRKSRGWPRPAAARVAAGGARPAAVR